MVQSKNGFLQSSYFSILYNIYYYHFLSFLVKKLRLFIKKKQENSAGSKTVRQNKKVKNIDPTLFFILGGVYFLHFFDFVKFLLKNLLPGNMPKKRLPDSPPRNKKGQNFILAQETTGHMDF